MAEWTPQVTRRYDCPIGTCGWAHDTPGPTSTDGSGMTTDEIVFSAVAAHLAGIEAIVRAHLETHSLLEWATEVGRLRGLVPEPVPDLTAVPWRLGGSHKRNVYAEAGFSDGKPGTYAGHMDTDGLAARACSDHNAALDLESLLADGWQVETHRAPAGRADVAFQATLRRLGDRVSVFSGESPAEAIRKAREGITS